MNGAMNDTLAKADGSPPDLLALDQDFNFISPERRAMIAASTRTALNHSARSILPFNDVPMVMDDDGVRAPHASQEGASRFDTEALTEATERNAPTSFPRPILAHRRQHAPYRHYPPPLWRSDCRAPRYSAYYDRDNLGAHRHSASPRGDSLDALRQKAQGHCIAVMADADVKDEREDRRERGGYRGNNKRRRDNGKCAPLYPYSPTTAIRSQAKRRTQMIMTTTTAVMTVEDHSDAATMTVHAADSRKHRSLSFGVCC